MNDAAKPGPLAAIARRARDPQGLAQRVSELEAEVAELRRLSLRVAELTDIVQELLVPLAHRDPERAVEMIDRYRDDLGS